MARDDIKKDCYCDDCGAEFKLQFARIFEHEFTKIYCPFCKTIISQWEGREQIEEDDDEGWNY